MGSAASIQNDSDGGTSPSAKTEVVLKKLPDAVEEAIYVYEKFPLVIDPTEQASRFFKYQTGAFINFGDPLQSTKASLNRALVASLLKGRTMTIKFDTLNGLTIDSMFEKRCFPPEVLNRHLFFQEDVWKSVLKPELGDPPLDEAFISSEFSLIICTSSDYVPEELKNVMHIIKVIEKPGNSSESDNNCVTSGDQSMDQIASMFGATEIIRNSLQLVEAAFDGDIDEIRSQLDKGYHLESFDGHKQTALSEAACQGHLHVIKFLLEKGADPNSVAANGRTALWRAAFNGHKEVVQVLLEAGADPQFRDKISMESAFDVASDKDTQTILAEWNPSKTEALMAERRRVIMKNLEERIKSSVERESLAKNIIRKELVEKAEKGDVEGIKELLHMIVDEAEKTKTKPRASVEVRNDLGQSLLSIAAQNDYDALAEFLLTYWKKLDEDRIDLVEGEISQEAKVFKANPNSRDLKGWTCVCIAVFHDSRKVLRLLLEHGGNPNIRSSYNKNAWDLAKDDLDAAENIVKSRAEIRQVLIDHDKSPGPSLFAKGEIVRKEGNILEGLDKDGSPVVLNIEMNKEIASQAAEKDKKNKGKPAGGKGKGKKK